MKCHTIRRVSFERSSSLRSLVTLCFRVSVRCVFVCAFIHTHAHTDKTHCPSHTPSSSVCEGSRSLKNRILSASQCAGPPRTHAHPRSHGPTLTHIHTHKKKRTAHTLTHAHTLTRSHAHTHTRIAHTTLKRRTKTSKS